jgi:hypothetical protein
MEAVEDISASGSNIEVLEIIHKTRNENSLRFLLITMRILQEWKWMLQC